MSTLNYDERTETEIETETRQREREKEYERVRKEVGGWKQDGDAWRATYASIALGKTRSTRRITGAPSSSESLPAMAAPSRTRAVLFAHSRRPHRPLGHSFCASTCGLRL